VTDERVERWLEQLVSTPGLTSIRDPAQARRVHVEDALEAARVLGAGPVVDVGSGGGSPGIPLAAARPDLEFHLLESTRKKCAFLSGIAADFPNVEVVCARAEEHAAGSGRDFYGTAVARALAPPILFVGPSADVDVVARVAARLGSEEPQTVGGFLVLRKVAPTPAGFPRRPGMARKRPLA